MPEFWCLSHLLCVGRERSGSLPKTIRGQMAIRPDCSFQKSLRARRAIFSADCREPADRRPVRQQVIATLGRLEELQASGQLQRLLRSGARFAAHALVLERCESNHRHGELDGGYRAA